MIEGKVKGYFLWGQNPAVGSAGARLQRLALAKLDWLVVRDLAMIESATFWQDSPEIATGELATEQIGTEVFFLPAAAHVEKAGSFTNTQRMLQWHHKAVEPPGDARSDLWFTYHLGKRIRAKLAGSPDDGRPLVQALTWDYPEHGADAEPDAEAVLAGDQRVRGRRDPAVGLRAARPRRLDRVRDLDLFRLLRCRGEPDRQAQAAGRAVLGRAGVGLGLAGEPADPVQPGFRRPAGQAVERAKRYVWWDEEAGEWTGHDVPDFEKNKSPDYRPARWRRRAGRARPAPTRSSCSGTARARCSCLAR